MVLADTSVWIDHLRRGDAHLAALLQQNTVLMHPFVLGELACGNLGTGKARTEILALLAALPLLAPAAEHEVLQSIEHHRLMGCGIGYIDAHLLAAVAIQRIKLWTHDKRLRSIAVQVGSDYVPAAH